MIKLRFHLFAVAITLFCSVADAQLEFQRSAKFEDPSGRARRITGGREVEFSEDGEKLIVAFYGSAAQLFDLKERLPIGKPIRTAGDGEVGFVNNEVAYTADWDSVRLWDTKSGKQIGEAIPHELREDTIISPAIDSKGKLIATRATMKSVHLMDVATRKLVGTALNYPGIVNSIRFSDDGALLFVKTGGSLHAINVETGEEVAGAIKSGWQFKFFSGQQKLVTIEQVKKDLSQLVIRSTDQKGWPEAHRSDLPGRLKRLIVLGDNQVLVQVTKTDYTPEFISFNLDRPEERLRVKSNADRAFKVVVTQDKRHWVCSNIRNISCYKFGESEPVWQKQVPASGYDRQLYPLDNEHFIVRDKQENFSVCKVADGSEVWTRKGVKRFKLLDDAIAFCTSDGVELWTIKKTMQ